MHAVVYANHACIFWYNLLYVFVCIDLIVIVKLASKLNYNLCDNCQLTEKVVFS